MSVSFSQFAAPQAAGAGGGTVLKLLSDPQPQTPQLNCQLPTAHVPLRARGERVADAVGRRVRLVDVQVVSHLHMQSSRKIPEEYGFLGVLWLWVPLNP